MQRSLYSRASAVSISPYCAGETQPRSPVISVFPSNVLYASSSFSFRYCLHVVFAKPEDSKTTSLSDSWPLNEFLMLCSGCLHLSVKILLATWSFYEIINKLWEQFNSKHPKWALFSLTLHSRVVFYRHKKGQYDKGDICFLTFHLCPREVLSSL